MHQSTKRRRDARQQIGVGPDRKRHQHHNDQEKRKPKAKAAACAHRKAQIADQQSVQRNASSLAPKRASGLAANGVTSRIAASSRPRSMCVAIRAMPPCPKCARTASANKATDAVSSDTVGSSSTQPAALSPTNVPDPVAVFAPLTRCPRDGLAVCSNQRRAMPVDIVLPKHIRPELQIFGHRQHRL